MLLIIYLLAILMGLVLGILGAGGAVLTIPILVYLAGFSTLDAISASLFVVCFTSLAAGINYARSGNYNVRAIVLFGLSSILSVWLARALVLPAIPDQLLSMGSFELSKSNLLLLLFAFLVLFSSIRMIKSPKGVKPAENNTQKPLHFIGIGLFVGGVTGLLGAGGGFLIVPALVLLLGLDFKKAAGSSLFIISINTAVGMLSNLDALDNLNWPIILSFTGIALISSLFGAQLASKIPSTKLKPAFGYFLLLVSIFIVIKEIFYS